MDIDLQMCANMLLVYWPKIQIDSDIYTYIYINVYIHFANIYFFYAYIYTKLFPHIYIYTEGYAVGSPFFHVSENAVFLLHLV